MGLIVTTEAERPAGKKGECFYCKAPTGSDHDNDCILAAEQVPVLIEMTDTGSGLTRTIDYIETPYYPAFEYRWRDGNQSCDCNRARLFYADDLYAERECGDGRFVVRGIRRKDNRELLYSDRLE